MKTIKETLELALEALQRDGWKKAGDAIRALEEALTSVPDWASEVIEQPSGGATLAPVAKPHEQEPLTDEHIERIYHRYGGDMINCARAIERAAQRTWVGLTIEDKKEYIAQDFGGSRTDAMDWTEKRLKEKNSD